MKTQFALASGKSLFLTALFSPPATTLSLLYILHFALLTLIYVVIKNTYQERMALNKKAESEYAKFEEFKSLSKQIAHDAKNPLSVMTILSSSSELNENFRNLLKIASERIMFSMSELQSAASDLSTFNIQESIGNVAKEYRVTHGIIFKVIKSEGLEVVGVRNEFERILSNIILNSIEGGHPKNAELEIHLNNGNNICEIEIKDKGRGIPDNVLKRLGTQPFSYGKVGGQGLGLSSAFKTLRKWQGNLEISSSSTGATVVIYLKLKT